MNKENTDNIKVCLKNIAGGMLLVIGTLIGKNTEILWLTLACIFTGWIFLLNFNK